MPEGPRLERESLLGLTPKERQARLVSEINAKIFELVERMQLSDKEIGPFARMMGQHYGQEMKLGNERFSRLSKLKPNDKKGRAKVAKWIRSNYDSLQKELKKEASAVLGKDQAATFEYWVEELERQFYNPSHVLGNLIQNPQFHDGVTLWNVWGGEVAVQEQYVYWGKAAVRIGPGVGGLGCRRFDVEPGRRYREIVYVKKEKADDQITVGLRWYDQNGKLLRANSLSTRRSTQWEEYRQEVVAPESAAKAEVYLWRDKNQRGEGAVYGDHFSFVEL